MARTIEEIKARMTGEFIKDENARAMYKFDPLKTFDEQFSKVSIESIIFHVVAVATWSLESLFDLFRDEVDERVQKAIVASIPWYYDIAREYQHGDALVYNEVTKQFTYPVENLDKRLVKYVAVRDRGNSVVMLVSGETGGLPSALPVDILTAFKYYLNRRKPAGVLVAIRSTDPDIVIINVTARVNPLLLNPDGSMIEDGTFPVEIAVENYLKDIVYGGTFNKTKLVDAIQKATGVEDVTLGTCLAKTASAAQYTVITGNNYVAESGAFKTINSRECIKYVVQD